jgi:ABC-type sugar transport system substrate-binding protein
MGPHFAEGSAFDQMEQLFSCTRGDIHPDAVLLTTAGRQSQQPACRRVLAAGLSVVFLNRLPDYLDELRDANPDLLVAGVAPDQEEIGRIQARQCASILPAGGRALLVTGTPDNPSAMARQRGLQQGLAPGIDLHVAEGQWTEQSGHAAVSLWLRLATHQEREIDLVVCQNDQMARGVRRALVDHAEGGALAQVPILGCDGLPSEGQQMVGNGELVGTVVMPLTTGRAIDLLAAYWQVGSRPAQVLLTPDSYPSVDQLKLA